MSGLIPTYTIYLSDDPRVVSCLRERTINETLPQNGSTIRAAPLLSSRIDFEVHIILWQSVRGAGFSSN